MRYGVLNRRVPLLIGVALAAVYCLAYLGDPALPGNSKYPEGWWGWYDQGKYLASTLAFAHGDLDPAKHWYPLGFSLLAAPLAWAAPNHPYFLIGLASLIAAFAAFLAFARRLGIAAPWAALIFALGSMGDPMLIRDWAVPWNTAPATAFLWTMAAAAAASLQGRPRPLVVGLCAAAVVACRPTDAVTTLPCLLAAAWAAWYGTRRWAEIGRLVAGGAAVSLGYLALHVAIYGMAATPYMIDSQKIGFTMTDFGWRAYVILVDPRSWFQDGQGMLRRFPWMILGFAGILMAWRRGVVAVMLATMLMAHMALYISYVDLMPTGLWRFLNVHYFTWAMPGYALFAALLLWDLTRRADWRWAAGSVALVLAISAIRLEPTSVGVGQPAKMIDIAGPVPPFMATYMSRLPAHDDTGPLLNIQSIRAFPIATGTRVIGIRRWITGPLVWEDGTPAGMNAQGAQTRYSISLRWGWPRWLVKHRVHNVIDG